MEYKGISESEFHFVIPEVKTPLKELTELYNKVKDYSYTWNDYKKKYDPNKHHQPRGDGGLGAVYSPDLEGIEIKDYPVVKEFLRNFIFYQPDEKDINNESGLEGNDVTFMTYEPGFVFKKHTDREMQYNLMMPILPLTNNEPIHYWVGEDKDRDITDKKVATVYYNFDHPTVCNGKALHSVDEIKEHRVIFRIKLAKESFESIRERYKRGTFLTVND